MKYWLLVMVVLLPWSVAAQTPTKIERLNVALGITSLSASSMALGLTMACTSDGTCREVAPVMRRLIGDGTVRAVTLKAGLQGVAHYAVWLGTKGKTRTIALAALAALNVVDAVHDVRQTRKIERR